MGVESWNDLQRDLFFNYFLASPELRTDIPADREINLGLLNYANSDPRTVVHRMMFTGRLIPAAAAAYTLFTKVLENEDAREAMEAQAAADDLDKQADELDQQADEQDQEPDEQDEQGNGEQESDDQESDEGDQGDQGDSDEDGQDGAGDEDSDGQGDGDGEGDGNGHGNGDGSDEDGEDEGNDQDWEDFDDDQPAPSSDELRQAAQEMREMAAARAQKATSHNQEYGK